MAKTSKATKTSSTLVSGVQLPVGTKTSPYSTCNAWGFGGSYGTEYALPNGWIVRKGSASFRHLPSHPILYAVSPAGKKYLDLSREGLQRLLADVEAGTI